MFKILKRFQLICDIKLLFLKIFINFLRIGIIITLLKKVKLPSFRIVHNDHRYLSSILCEQG